MTIMVPTRLETAEKAIKYMLGGRAVITVCSNVTDRHITYKITVNPNNANMHFVWVYSVHKYRFVGTLKDNGRKFFRSKKSISNKWVRYNVFVWAWRHIRNGSMPKTMAIYHENTCCRCGRKLTNPKSIKLGIGPECIKHY